MSPVTQSTGIPSTDHYHQGMTSSALASLEEQSVPSGFRSVQMGGPFIAANGPLYARLDGKRLQMGFRVEARHTNPLGMCHGGMLATFADMVLPMACLYQIQGERRFLPTISLQTDFLSPALVGAWVQGEGELLRTTRNMVFAQGLVRADGEVALRISAIFKRGPVMDDGLGDDPLQLR